MGCACRKPAVALRVLSRQSLKAGREAPLPAWSWRAARVIKSEGGSNTCAACPARPAHCLRDNGASPDLWLN